MKLNGEKDIGTLNKIVEYEYTYWKRPTDKVLASYILCG